MKKLFCSLLILLFSFVLFVPFACAAGEPVVDRAGLLSPSEEKELSARINDMRALYGCDFVILTVNNLDDKLPRDYADDYYDYNGYSRDGVLFLLDITSRNYWTSTKGQTISVLNDYFIDSIDNSDVITLLGDGEFAQAFGLYLDIAADFYDKDAAGEPYGSGNPYRHKLTSGQILIWSLIIVGISVAVGFIYAGSLKAKMNTAAIQKYAADYVEKDSFELKSSNDIFMYSRTRRIPKPKSNSSGTGSIHRSSSGSFHGGGGGRF